MDASVVDSVPIESPLVASIRQLLSDDEIEFDLDPESTPFKSVQINKVIFKYLTDRFLAVKPHLYQRVLGRPPPKNRRFRKSIPTDGDDPMAAEDLFGFNNPPPPPPPLTPAPVLNLSQKTSAAAMLSSIAAAAAASGSHSPEDTPGTPNKEDEEMAPATDSKDEIKSSPLLKSYLEGRTAAVTPASTNKSFSSSPPSSIKIPSSTDLLVVRKSSGSSASSVASNKPPLNGSSIGETTITPLDSSASPTSLSVAKKALETAADEIDLTEEADDSEEMKLQDNSISTSQPKISISANGYEIEEEEDDGDDGETEMIDEPQPRHESKKSPPSKVTPNFPFAPRLGRELTIIPLNGNGGRSSSTPSKVADRLIVTPPGGRSMQPTKSSEEMFAEMCMKFGDDAVHEMLEDAKNGSIRGFSKYLAIRPSSRKVESQAGQIYSKAFYICNQDGCENYDLKSSEACLRHILKVHFGGMKLFSCPICQHGFDIRKTLKNHVAVVHGPRLDVAKFRCPEPGCDFSTPLKPNLLRHLDTHEGIKKFKCDFPNCDKLFTSKANLLQHRAAHSGERPFKCSPCNVAFNWRRSYNEHVARFHPYLTNTAV